MLEQPAEHNRPAEYNRPAERNRLMIVDDALIMRMRIKEIAVQAGWTIVAEAENGEEAVEKFHQHQPDLMTLDMVMPKMDGLTALQTIRKQHPTAAIVMVSAVNQKEKLRACIESGALDFIVKPFDAQRLGDFFAKYGNKAKYKSKDRPT